MDAPLYSFFIWQIFGHIPYFTILRKHPDLFSTPCVWQFMRKSNSIRIFVRALQTGILRSCQLYETCGTTWLTWVSSFQFFENTILLNIHSFFFHLNMRISFFSIQYPFQYVMTSKYVWLLCLFSFNDWFTSFCILAEMFLSKYFD